MGTQPTELLVGWIPTTEGDCSCCGCPIYTSWSNRPQKLPKLYYLDIKPLIGGYIYIYTRNISSKCCCCCCCCRRRFTEFHYWHFFFEEALAKTQLTWPLSVSRPKCLHKSETGTWLTFRSVLLQQMTHKMTHGGVPPFAMEMSRSSLNVGNGWEWGNGIIVDRQPVDHSLIPC